VELGYAFPRAHWDKGYATEAAQSAIDFAFGLKRVVAIIFPENHASRRHTTIHNSSFVKHCNHPDVGQKECARITERGSFAFSSSQGKVPRSTTGRLQ
jgi:predicted acetyltransferase